MLEVFDWFKPSLVWQTNGQDFRKPDFFRPQLLEFRSDSFMDDFFTAAGTPKPDALQNYILAAPTGPNKNLKLFQPVHGRYYLTCTSLCCRLPGFPDREVRLADGENVFFVLRKLVGSAEAGWTEHGWVADDPNKGWHTLENRPRRVLNAKERDKGNEERLPLFSTSAGNNRPLFFGYVPVASRETYAVAPSELTGTLSPQEQTDLRIEELKARFIEPLGLLGSAGTTIALRLSIYFMLDLWEFFFLYVQDVAVALRDGTTATLTEENADLMNFLQTQHLGGTINLAGALGTVARARDQLNNLGDESLPTVFNDNYNLKRYSLNTDGLKEAVGKALPSQEPSVEVPKVAPQAGDMYVLRCVYERPQCDPPQSWVSQPSEPFELAPFFDPDAPARQIRIGLPVDVSIAGLRKFQKGVAFMMSTALRNKIARITGKEKEVLSGGSLGGEGTATLGHICSFSIPIITICAFILLMIIVVLLNIVFWWLPFFKICLPLRLSSR
jgi:hypothetical protein